MKDRLSQRYARVTITMLMLLIMCAFHGHALAQSRAADSRAPSPFDGIKKTYSEIVTLEARFQQKIFIASLKKERDSDGEFLYKRHKGFLWKYKTPKVRYFLYDGRYIWQGDEEKPFVIKERIRKEKTGGTFLDLIDDIAKLDELFNLTRSRRSGDLEVLELTPKKEGTVTAARVFIDRQNVVKRIEIDEFTGNTNAIEFSSIKINREIDDGRFVFKPDKEKEIIER
jgi:chaperone LolA